MALSAALLPRCLRFCSRKSVGYGANKIGGSMFRTLQFQPTTQNSIAAFRTVQTARVRSSFRMFGLMALALLLSPSFAHAEAGGASSSITGTVADPSGAVVPGATVEIQNPVSRFDRSTTTDDAGKFTFPNVPLNPYHLTVNLAGFAPYAQDVDVRSAVPLVLKITLQIRPPPKTLRCRAKPATWWRTIPLSIPM